MPSFEVIAVFLASPGDVSREREVAREVIDLVNRRVAKHFELHVELYGWEDQPPGYGRPQAQINPHVDEADLFIGMLWRRWGTPSGDDHSSGFEEEYQRARKRREGGEDRPEVWLFFKDVDDGQRADAGPELLRVLAFRQQVQDTREALYDSFKDEDDWRAKLYLLITEFVAKWQQTRQRQEPEGAPEAPAVETEDAAEAKGAEQQTQGPSDASRQLVQALEDAREVISESDGGERPDLFQAARLLLASFRWVSELQTSETLDTHELNLLYSYRERLAVLPRERLQLMRSMLTGQGVRPGWFWMVGSGNPAIPLAYLATTDANPEVRRRAVETLGDAALLVDVPETLADLRPEPFLRQVLDDVDTRVRIAGLELAGRLASDAAVELLRALQDDPKLKGHAASELARALLQRAPDDALDVLSTEPTVAVEMTDELLAVAESFGDEAIARLSESQSPALRNIALRIEAESGRVTEERARVALGDEDMSIRGLALDAMQAAGWTISDDIFDEVVKSAFLPTSRAHQRRLLKAMTRPIEALREDANWYLPYAETAYEALARLDWETVGDRVRRDLDDRFEGFRKESMEQLRRRFGALGVEKLGTEREYGEQYFLRAALSVLGENGTQEDAERVRSYLTHERPEVRRKALAALRRLAPEAATDDAVRIALSDDERAEARLAAAKTALELSPAVALQLMESADAAVASLAIASVPKSERTVEQLTDLLRSEISSVREAAARRLGELLDRSELKPILTAYMEQHYFYNVVVWLDRFLYCPEPFIERYIRREPSP